MGLFSSRSKSSSTTSYNDNSTNLEVDLSGGDLSSGASKNIIAGGDLQIDGLSEDMASQIFGVIQEAYRGATDWVNTAIGTTNANNAKAVAAIQQAYNSEQASASSLKTFALYALVGFIAWAYFGKGK